MVFSDIDLDELSLLTEAVTKWASVADAGAVTEFECHEAGLESHVL